MKGKWNHSERPSKEDSKNEYIIVDWDRPHGHERLPSKPILLEKKEAEDLNKMLTLNGENKRYVKL